MFDRLLQLFISNPYMLGFASTSLWRWHFKHEPGLPLFHLMLAVIMGRCVGLLLIVVWKDCRANAVY